MPTQIEKLKAHASHLLDLFIGLRERYSILHPMLFDPKIAGLHGAGSRAHGFQTLRLSLFFSCAQDIAKLSLDRDDRTPSIRRLANALDNVTLEAELREQFAVWVLPDFEAETDPEILEALKRIELREQAERRASFNEILARVKQGAADLAADPALEGFLTIRDKVSAHSEVHLVAEKYQRIDIGQLGLKWADMKRVIDLMQATIADLGLLIRNTAFAWDSLEEQLTRSSVEFWRPHPA